MIFDRQNITNETLLQLYKKLVKPSFSKISLKWRRKIAIKSGFISSFIFKKSLYLDGFSRFDQKISHQNNYFLRACILNAISKSTKKSVIYEPLLS
jgi:hypothetical protein